jgi:hypothetical protein
MMNRRRASTINLAGLAAARSAYPIGRYNPLIHNPHDLMCQGGDTDRPRLVDNRPDLYNAIGGERSDQIDPSDRQPFALKKLPPPPAQIIAVEYSHLFSIVEKLLQSHNSTGGATISLTTGNMSGQEGYAVGVAPERSEKFLACPSRIQVFQFIVRNLDLLVREDIAVGSWFDSCGRTHLLDVVTCVSSRQRAGCLAKQFRQSSIFDLSSDIEIPILGLQDSSIVKRGA